MTAPVGAEPATGPALANMAMFAVFVAAALVVLYRAGGRTRSTPENPATGGLALTGDYLCATTLLGMAGAIALGGQDGFLYAVGLVVGWLLYLLVIAEPVRNTGRTASDVLARRMRHRPVRAASAAAAMAISLCYLLAQVAGAGGLVVLLLGVQHRAAQSVVIALTGLAMVGCVLAGGIRGGTRVQAVKAAGMLLCAGSLAAFLLGKFGFSLSSLLAEAADRNALGERLVEPAAAPGSSALARLDLVSLGLALALGAAGLPHLVARPRPGRGGAPDTRPGTPPGTTPDGVLARRSTAWAIAVLCGFFLATFVIGYGASAMVGSAAIDAAPGGGNSALPLLARRVGGTVLLGLACAVAFAAILALFARLIRCAATAFARDVYAGIACRGSAEPAAEARAARLTALFVGLLAVCGGVAFSGHNVAFLVSLAFAFAASANLSPLLYSLFWRRFTATGALCGCYGGLLSCLLLTIFSPVVSGTPASALPGVDFSWFPLTNPALVSVPLSFLCGALGTVLGSGHGGAPHRQAEAEVRALTGLGA